MDMRGVVAVVATLGFAGLMGWFFGRVFDESTGIFCGLIVAVVGMIIVVMDYRGRKSQRG